MKGPPWFFSRLFDLFLLSFPRRYRRRYGKEMRQFLQDSFGEERERGRTPGSGFWLRSYWGLLANGMGLRFQHLMGRRPMGGGESSGQPTTISGGAGTGGRSFGYAFRSLTRSPGYSLTSLLTLGLGIGGCTVIFSVIYPVLLAPLPYPDSDQIAVLYERSPGPEGQGGWVSPLTFRDWREEIQAFEDIVSYRLDILNWTDGDTPELLRGWAVSAGFFPLMGLEMTMGRGFAPEEDQPGGERVAVISHGFWTRNFGSDPDVLGRTLTLDGAQHTIVGVANPDLDFPPGGEYWHPAAIDYSREFRDFRYLGLIGRIRPGAGQQEARADLDRISRMVEAENPDTNTGWGATLESLENRQVGRVEPMLLGMAVAVAILLLIAIGNLTNLTIARSVSRRVDTAIRQALGADRPVLARHFLTESILISMAGSGVGLLLAFGGLGLLNATTLLNLPRVSGVGMDLRSVLFALSAALLSGLLLGGVSFLAARGMGLSDTLRAGGAGRMASSRIHQIREVVLASQVALALVLLIGAALLTRSLMELNRVDPGFDPDHLMTFSFNLPFTTYSEPEAIERFGIEAPARLREMPGIEAAGLITPIPMEMGSVPSSWSLPPDVRDPAAGAVTAHMRTASPGYFPAMDLALRAGRLIEPTDGSDTESVVVVNQAFVDSYLQGRNPLGIRVTAGEPEADPEDWSTIVGVVGNVRFRSLRVDSEPEIYLPATQFPTGWGHIVVRSHLPRETLIRSVSETILGIDPSLPLSDIMSGNEMLGRQLRVSRLSVLLSTLFAVTATVMAAVGILGVLSILVAQRMREIGLRMVLGAGTGNVWKFVLVRGLRPVLIGLVLGVGGALWGTRFLESQIHQVSPLDPPAFILPFAVLSLASLVVCLVPGVRALAADPADLLRSE